MTLPVRLLTGDDDDRAVVVERHLGDLLPHDGCGHVLLTRNPGPGRRLEVRGHADAQVPSRSQRFGLTSTEVVPCGDVCGLLDLFTGRDRDERLAREHRQRRHVPLDVVAPADVERIELELACDHVEQALAQEVPRRPWPPVRHVRGLVAEHGGVLRPDALELRGALERAAQRIDVDGTVERVGGVGAEVQHGVDPDAEQHAVVGDRRFDVGPLLARLSTHGKVLEPVLDPLHRPAEIDRRRHDGDLVALHAVLQAEPAADVVGEHTDPLHRYVDLWGQQDPQHVR